MELAYNQQPLERGVRESDGGSQRTGNVLYAPYRRLISPQRVKELSRLRPWIPVFHTASQWAFIIGAWALVALHPSWWSIPLAMFIVGNRYYALFIIGHDAFHRRVFPKVQTNDLFSDLFLLGPIGAIARINKANHLAHHTHLSTDRDPDRNKYQCSEKATHGDIVGYLTGFTNIGKSIRAVFWNPAVRNRNSSAADADDEQDTGEDYRVRDVVILICWQLLLIGGLTWAIGWWAYPVLWLVPVYLFTYLGDSARSFCEHAQPMPNDEAYLHRLITYHAPWYERAIFSPMNMNYHAAHHLWPSVPYYNLPQLDRELKAVAGDTPLEWRSSYVGFIWSYIKKLPLVDCLRERELKAR